ncbi:peptidylprolyl isomerase [Algoriphagus mannitolivorans]|uniref:peptidylprolyl isomerase n=1 Tax=Algoriphagus mannitolivorans TaxID=226504 RepID=UPI0004009F84|nr:peptidylprolyl isomerase [Algoriphagus mannitolivorans]
MYNKPLFLFTFLLLTTSIQPFAQTPDQTPFGIIRTPLGEILLELDQRTPQHRESFIKLAEAGYWDSLSFNRVIPNFVAQGGCPDTPEGFTDPEYLLEPEFHPELTHVYGALGAGRDDNPGKLSARCQFYIVQNRNGLHRLDGNYTVFGKVIKGMDIVDRIVQVSRDESDQPLSPITLDIDIIYLSKDELNRLIER